MAESLGLAIGVGALLQGLKGTVDTFLLIDAIVEADNGQRYLALKYYIERRKLDVWSDHFMLQDPETSPLRLETTETRTLIAAILAEIRATNESSKKYLKRYDMRNLATVNLSGTPEVDNSVINDHLIQAIRADRDSRSQSHRFIWASKDKTKFGELVNRLQTLVADLYTVTRIDRNESVDRALLVYVLSTISDPGSLSALQTRSTGAGSLITLAARLKEMQMSSGTASGVDVKEIPFHNIEFTEQTKTIKSSKSPIARQLCYVSIEGSVDQRAWVEWKLIPSHLAFSDQEQLIHRMKSLGKMLSALKPAEFRVPLCLGVTQVTNSRGDELSASRFSAQHSDLRSGYLYAYPDGDYDHLTEPISLFSELASKSRQMPLLNDRFRLAYSLASSMSLLHASRWLHKGFRSSNILFLKPLNRSLTITDPFVTGFDYSRPEGPFGSIEQVITGNPEIDLYYHPNTNQGFTRLRDFYSLGVVLFEIALWRPLQDKIPNLRDLSMKDIYQFLLDAVPSLGGVMGATYRDVVDLCLRGNFGVSDDADGAAIGRVFFQRVVRELEKCRV